MIAGGVPTSAGGSGGAALLLGVLLARLMWQPQEERAAHMDEQLHAIADAQHRNFFLLHILVKALWQLGCTGCMHRVGTPGQDDGPWLLLPDPFLHGGRLTSLSFLLALTSDPCSASCLSRGV